MKTTINGYEFRTCRAIAVGEDEDYQNAIFCHKLDDEFRDGDAVIFGDYDLPQDADDAKNMFGDHSAWALDQETLDTVIFDDGEEDKTNEKDHRRARMYKGWKIEIGGTRPLHWRLKNRSGWRLVPTWVATKRVNGTIQGLVTADTIAEIKELIREEESKRTAMK